MELAVIDYGNGNLGSLLAALRRLRQEPVVISGAAGIQKVDAVIFPGVGSLEDVVSRLRQNGVLPWLNDLHAAGTPILGICLGMQLFFEQGEEGGEGLGWLAGTVPEIHAPVLPHIGWNSVDTTSEPFLWQQIKNPPTFYFVHTYRIRPADPAIIRGRTEYYESFPAAIEAPPLYGVQFHPELSGPSGAQFLQNFLEMVEKPHGNLASRRLA